MGKFLAPIPDKSSLVEFQYSYVLFWESNLTIHILWRYRQYGFYTFQFPTHSEFQIVRHLVDWHTSLKIVHQLVSIKLIAKYIKLQAQHPDSTLRKQVSLSETKYSGWRRNMSPSFFNGPLLALLSSPSKKEMLEYNVINYWILQDQDGFGPELII